MKLIPQNCRAFSLVELLTVVAVIGVLSGVAYVGVTGVQQGSRDGKLRNDVAALNNAIDAYIAAYGTIPAAATAEQVVAKLKTVAAPDTATGLDFTGPFIDPRLQIVMQSGEDAASTALRADYPNSAGYFYVRSGGLPGIKEFALGASSELVTESRQGLMSTDPTDAAPTSPAAAVGPSSAAGVDTSPGTGRDLPKLPRPTLKVRYYGTTVFVPYSGETLPLSKYPLTARVSSPVSSEDAQLQYSWDGGALTPASSIYTSDEVDPNKTISARVISLSTNRFASSDPISMTFKVKPEVVVPIFPTASDVPSTLTYAQAGGAMVGQTLIARPPVTISLSNIDKVPPRYLTSEYLEAVSTTTRTERYTSLVTVTTNTAFSSAGGFSTVTIPIDVAGFGVSTKLDLFASVQSFRPDFLVVTEDLNRSISIAPTALAVNVLPLKPIGLPQSVTITDSGPQPVGMRKFYTLTTGGSGASPLNPVSGGVPKAAATNYSSPITSYPIATYTIVAQATGPSGAEHWFTCSPVNRTYIAITTVPLSYIGLNMYEANINGYVKGSIYMQAGNFAVLNAGSTIDGNVYVPGLPRVTLPGGSGGTVVNYGQSYNSANDASISTNRITGREYTTEGVLADPQSDLRKIVDLYGSTSSTPANYEVKVNNTARIDGKLYRRADPPPVSSTKPSLPPGMTGNNPVNVVGTNTLGAGSYAVTMTNTNAVLRLGVPGTLTQYVFGEGSVWNSGRVEILGVVQIFLNTPTAFNGVTFGSSNSIYQTGFVVMSNYTVSIDNNSSVYGQFEARDSEISVGSGGGSTIRGSLFGSAFARKISVDGSGYVDVSGGSGTNSVTPGPSPSPTPRPYPSPSPTP